MDGGVIGDDFGEPEDEWLALDPIEREILSYLSKRGTSATNLASRLGHPYHRIYYHLVKLMILGLVKRSKLGHQKKCYISDKGRELVATSAEASSSVRKIGDGGLELANRQVCFSIAPEAGGRITEIRPNCKIFGLEDISNVLHTLYPSKQEFGKYTEFGGMEEQIRWTGSFPGSGWNQAWTPRILSEKDPASVILETRMKGSTGMDLRRTYTLDTQEPLIRVERKFKSRTERFLIFRWTGHPELRGDLFDSYSVPRSKSILTGSFQNAGRQTQLQCEGNWWLAYSSDSGLFLGEIYPEGVLDLVSVYNPKVGDHYVILPEVHGRLVPRQVTSFESFIILGMGGPESFAGYLSSLKPKSEIDAEWQNGE